MSLKGEFYFDKANTGSGNITGEYRNNDGNGLIMGDWLTESGDWDGAASSYPSSGWEGSYRASSFKTDQAQAFNLEITKSGSVYDLIWKGPRNGMPRYKGTGKLVSGRLVGTYHD